MIKAMSIFLFVLSFSCANVNNTNGEETVDTYGYQRAMAYNDSLLSSIERDTQWLMKQRYPNYITISESSGSYDTSAISAYHDKGNLKLISIDNRSFFYFDDGSRFFAFKYLFDDSRFFIDIFSQPTFSYSKTADGIILNDTNRIGWKTRIGMIKAINDIMQYFNDLHYSNIEMPAESKPSLITFGKITLNEKPDAGSKIVEILDKRSRVVFLGETSKRDTVNGKSWIWYKVKSNTGKIGWIFGHPDDVGELNDENY